MSVVMLYRYLFCCIFLALPTVAHPVDYRVLRSVAATSTTISASASNPRTTGLVEKSTFDLGRVLEGNQRFRQQRFNLTTETENLPGVMFIGCSDNRFSHDAIFRARPGSTLSHTNIANQFSRKDPSSYAAVEYAVNSLRIQHIVVVGHYGCGGVHAAMSSRSMDSITRTWLQPVNDLFSRSRRSEIKKLIYSRRMFDKTGAAEADSDAHRALVEENVKATVQNIRNESVLSAAYRNGAKTSQLQVFVHGLILDESGEVKDLGVSFGPPGQPVQSLPLEVVPPQEHHNSFGKYKPKAKKLEPASTTSAFTSSASTSDPTIPTPI